MQGYVDYIEGILFFGLIGAVFLWVAKAKGFFYSPHAKEVKKPIRFSSVVAVFAIYLAMTMVVAPFLIYIITAVSAKHPPLVVLGYVQVFSLIAIFLLFYLYSKAADPLLFKRIWKDYTIPHPKPIYVDFLMGMMTWIICIPLILAVGQLFDLLLYLFFNFESYEQVAVRYLKTTLESPQMLTFALFTILIAAPVIEEFLFRGCLQNFFKKYMSTTKAIMLSALCFSVFHYSASQGIGNISLIASLFTLALFLGFIYERQGSLFASIGLHITFNTISTLKIMFIPDGT